MLPEQKNESLPRNQLVSWILERTEKWRDHRDSNYKEKWDEYYRLWRGMWSSEDKTRESERSRIIAPALQQAIETMVSELEEATFGRSNWIDVSDDILDEEKEDLQQYRKLMLEDFKVNGITKAISETFLNAAIYGTGIAKITVEESVIKTPVETQKMGIAIPAVVSNKEYVVKLYAIEPSQFLIDSAARNIEEAMGCAHETIVPIYTVIKKQLDGVYLNDQLVTPWNDDGELGSERRGELRDTDSQNKVKILEYHGLVPKKLLNRSEDQRTDNDATKDEVVSYKDLAGITDEDPGTLEEFMEAEMIEAIVVIANDHLLLKAEENPYIMKDRCFIAYQHDTVPNRFWGRGVAEKGYNAQKALDAELRARIDALAFSTHPMMGIDSTRIPRGFNFKVSPGRSILTTGNPAETLFPLNFNPPDFQTYRQAADMERMVTMATGAMDGAAPLMVNSRNETASGMSMMMSTAIKRSKRTLANIERFFLMPLVNKFIWRSIQFRPEIFPSKDYKFVVNATMGIMAREYEQAQIAQLLNSTEPGSPAFFMLLKSFYNNSNSSDREQLVMLTDHLLQQSLNPPEPSPPPPSLSEQAQMAKVELDKAKAAADIKLEERKLAIEEQKLQIEKARLKLEEQKIAIDARIKLETASKQKRIKKYDPKTKSLK